MSSTQNGRAEDEVEANKCKTTNPVPLDSNEHTSSNNKTSTYLEFRKKLEWGSLKTMARQWIRSPVNMVLLVWILCVTISGAILFLVMTGMLNRALPRKYQREAWFEVNNQILNALFTLICLYHHPRRVYHLALLIRWRPEDVTKLRNIYSKNGTYKPQERKHMLIVVLLLNLNCLAQYALCSLNVGYTRSKRPAIGVAITISVAIAAPAIAGVYAILSPLGKDYDVDPDLESQVQDDKVVKSLEKRLSFSISSESSPKWSGAFVFLGGTWKDSGLETSPFWIFTMAAINIHNETMREALGTTGLFLCLFGLLYGGFWRIQMRKRYNLPPSGSCCGKPAVTDCALWLFCCWCSLAQEVRTGNSYDIVEAKFYKKDREGPGVASSPGSLVRDTVGRRSTVEEGASSRGNDTSLEPPFQCSINREALARQLTQAKHIA
ncbi:PLAC8 family protein [Artemisia annua]|uniref:PLAC8 family protein n=1 Tax=Artemisia annua TaxID=35608 RepID=A0A2U1MHM2_ARTAN|nr:PLAC8 family protein [Artemisia annua]